MTALNFRPGLLLGGLMLAVAILLLAPHQAYAWGPGTHVLLGVEVLRSLDLVPAAVASLLNAHPAEFLYGNLAADISMAKKYAPIGRHCHHWHVAREIRQSAGGDPRLEAAATGYLCHLAADVVAHNRFVPRMLLLTSSTRGLGHSYWEHRMDVQLGGEGLSLARRIVTEFDHGEIDALLDRVLSHTLFSFRTNRRIFRGLIRIGDYRRWQVIFDTVIDNSRWELDRDEGLCYLAASYNHVIDFLRHGDDSETATGDPIGEAALLKAMEIRRAVVRHEGWSVGTRLESTANRYFPLPESPSGQWSRRGRTAQSADDAIRTTLTGGGSAALRGPGRRGTGS
ncbi:MAG: zinc dependent phospholipase C family protein [Gemmatimonadota bacterium]